MSHLLIVKRLELYMDLALYKINILLLLLLSSLLLRIFIKLLTCVPPYGYRTSALAVVSAMRIECDTY